MRPHVVLMAALVLACSGANPPADAPAPAPAGEPAAGARCEKQAW